MIDLHSHILFGVDDGAKTIDDALEIATQSVSQGVTHMMCTPHIHVGVFDNTLRELTPAFNALKDIIIKNDIPLKLSLACEFRISPEVVSMISNNSLPFIGDWNNRRVLLLELPHNRIPAGTDTLIRWLMKSGVQPVIPHPERNREIIDNYSKVKWLRGLGCLFQVTAGVFVGRFSEKARTVASKLLEDRLVCYVASDTHNIKSRPNELNDSYDYLKGRVEDDYLNEIFFSNPEIITKNTYWS